MKLLALALFFLTGCSTYIDSTVTRFYDEDAIVKNSTYKFLPTDQQRASLEYKKYKKSISSKLASLGMKEADTDSASYGVFFTYGIDNGTEIVTENPIIGQTGGGATYHSGSVYSNGGFGGYSGSSYSAPTYGVVGTSTSVSTQYVRYLNLDIIDLNKSNNDNIAKIYEAKLKSKGSSSTFAQVSECLIETIFTDFYLNNGTSKEYTVPFDDCEVKPQK